MLDNLQKIVIENPVDIIIQQIRTLISSGDLKPGEKLPPERKLAEHMGVSRNQVREAIRKLEFYGILKTLPQSGTFVSGIGIVALEGLITDVLDLEEHDFQSLVETRVLLEKQAAFDAAKRRTPFDIAQLKKALNAYEEKVNLGESGVEEDLLFHIKIAEAGKNNVLKSLMMIITPDIVKNYNQLKVCNTSTLNATLIEHKKILEHIINQEPEAASLSMINHLKGVLEFSKKIN
jgi:GntR family transcriptional repressor for pyruvate dehydrogenase complex